MYLEQTEHTVGCDEFSFTSNKMAAALTRRCQKDLDRTCDCHRVCRFHSSRLQPLDVHDSNCMMLLIISASLVLLSLPRSDSSSVSVSNSSCMIRQPAFLPLLFFVPLLFCLPAFAVSPHLVHANFVPTDLWCENR